MSDAGKILIVDDDPDILTYVSEILQDNAYETSTAGDGAAALASVREARPDLVILDLMMPGKSGIRFLNEIRQDAALRDVPILVLSGATGVTGVDMRKYLEEPPFRDRKEKALGVAPDITPDAYLDKPVDPAILLEAVGTLIRRRT